MVHSWFADVLLCLSAKADTRPELELPLEEVEIVFLVVTVSNHQHCLLWTMVCKGSLKS